MATQMIQVNIETQGEHVVITIPKHELQCSNGDTVTSPSVHHNNAQPHNIDFHSLRGALKDIPEFQGKTSVEVQHMIGDIWAKKI